MSDKQEKIPHVANVGKEDGVFDVPVKHKDDQSKGHHSGRPHPKSEPAHTGFDYAAGVTQGPTTTQNRGE